MSNDNSNPPQEDKIDRNQTENTQKRRPYSPPRVLNAEPLEAAAAACDPPTGGFGKPGVSIPPCTAIGS